MKISIFLNEAKKNILVILLNVVKNILIKTPIFLRKDQRKDFNQNTNFPKWG